MASTSSFIISKLAIEDQLSLGRALLARHPTTTEETSGVQLILENNPHDLLTILEKATSQALIKNLELSSALLFNSSTLLGSDQCLVIALGCTLEYEQAQSKSKFTIDSGSVLRLSSTSFTCRVLPNTCPAALGSIPPNCSILLSLRSITAGQSGTEMLFYSFKAQESQRVFESSVATHFSKKDSTKLLLELWPQLPTEISQHIIRQLDIKGVMRFACVSNGTKALAYNDDQLWQTGASFQGVQLAASHRRLMQREIRNKSKSFNDSVMAIVLTLGSYHIDAGIAGDDTPDRMMPTVVREVRSFGQQPQVYAGYEATLVHGTNLPTVEKKQIMNTDHLMYLIEMFYVSHPWAKFEEQPLLLCCSARNVISNYDRFLYECVQRFNLPAIAMFESEILSLYAHGQTDGIVVDVGYECTTIVPVEEGYGIRADMRVLPVGGRHVTLELMRRIRALYPALNDLTEDEANDIKEKYCYFKTSGPYASAYEGAREVSIRGQHYRLDEVLHESCEVLFNHSESGSAEGDFKERYMSMLESLEHNHPKPKIRNNIVFAGATTLIPGYVQRFREVVQDNYKNNPSWKIRAVPYRKFVDWIGGSILGSMSCHPPFWVTKEQLEERLSLA